MQPSEDSTATSSTLSASVTLSSSSSTGGGGGWRRLPVSLWVSWFIAFAIFETLGKMDRYPNWPTLTRLVRKHIPVSAVIAFGSWLVAHFIETYHDPEY